MALRRGLSGSIKRLEWHTKTTRAPVGATTLIDKLSRQHQVSSCKNQNMNRAFKASANWCLEPFAQRFQISSLRKCKPEC